MSLSFPALDLIATSHAVTLATNASDAAANAADARGGRAMGDDVSAIKAQASSRTFIAARRATHPR